MRKWTPLLHLLQVKRGTTVIATFTYDGDGNKGSQVTRYYYVGTQRIAVPPAWWLPRAAHGALARCTLHEGEVHYR